MPKTTRHAPGKRRRVRAPANTRLRKVMDRALDMEEPLTEAMEFVQALRMIGNGMASDRDDSGRPIAAIAGAALQRLDVLKHTWLCTLNAGRKGVMA